MNLFSKHSKKEENPLFVKVKGKSSWYQKFVRDLAKELALWLNTPENLPKGSGKVSTWESQDLEIDRLKKLEEEALKNKLIHPIEKNNP